MRRAARAGQAGGLSHLLNGQTLAFALQLANELVPFERCGDLVSGAAVFGCSVRRPRSEHFADAANLHRLRPLPVQGDHVFDGPAQIRFSRSGEQDPGGADVFGAASERDTRGASAGDGDWQLQLESPGSTLVHGIVFMLSDHRR
jgi:hypothetical protein